MSGVILVCPFCRTAVADGVEEVAPGRCPGCEARYEGGRDDARGAVAAALEAMGAGDLPAAEIIDNLFALPPDDDIAHRVAITSDSREGFYRWWLFVREGPEGARGLLSCLTHRRHSGAG